MILRLFSVLDIKAGFFKPPFAARSDGEALRALSEAMRDPQTTLAQYPEDFALYETGNFNDATGTIEPTVPVRHLCGCAQLMPKPRPTDTTQPGFTEFEP